MTGANATLASSSLPASNSVFTSSKRAFSLAGSLATSCLSFSSTASGEVSASTAVSSSAGSSSPGGRCLSRNSLTLPSGSAPVKPSTGWPFTISMQVGMLLMPKAAPSCCSWSESIFTSLKRPPYAASTFSRMGPSDLHGPHQGAQKSISTGVLMEAVMTSSSKLAMVTSIMICRSLGLGEIFQPKGG